MPGALAAAAQPGWRPRRRRSGALAGWVLAAALLLPLAAPAWGQVVTQTPGRDLNFGACDNVGGTTYTVAAAASPGASACFGATSAEFTLTNVGPGPHQRVRVRLAATTVTVVNGASTLTVSLTKSIGNGPTCIPAAGLTVYVGGSVTLPGAGVTVFGPYSVATSVDATYFGGSTPCP